MSEKPDFGKDDLFWSTGFFLAAASFFLVRLWGIARGAELLPDEAQYWAWSKELAWGYYSKPPVIAWVIHAASFLGGDGEMALRLPSALAYTLAGVFVFKAASLCLGKRPGAWAGMLFLAMPGVAVGAQVMTTDAFLLLFWALAVYFLALAQKSAAPWPWLGLGAAVGLGMLSKYTMVLFPLILFPFVLNKKTQHRGFVLAMGLAFLIFLPNLLWNLRHGQATLAHTASISHMQKGGLHPGNFLEFFGAQIGVFGPAFLLLFPATAFFLKKRQTFWPALAWGVLGPFLLLAFLARALANWAAPAYAGGSILVARWVACHPSKKKTLCIILILQALISLAVAAGPQALGIAPGSPWDPWRRARGYRGLGEALKERSRSLPAFVLVAEERRLFAELLYYFRPGQAVKINPEGNIKDHFDLVAKPEVLQGMPALVVSEKPRCALCGKWGGKLLEPVRVQLSTGREKFFYLYWIPKDERP